MHTSQKVRKVCLFGASPDTGNRGVTALCHSVLWHLHKRGLDPVTVFDHGAGRRGETVDFGRCAVPVKRCGAVNSRRFHRPESLWQIRVATWLSPRFCPAAQEISQSDAILDVSAGDSFTDLYGPQRFRTVVLPKQIALEAGRPLILLPQTYGPFASDQARQVASSIIRRAHMAWARDADSFAALRDLLGDSFDPRRHRQGVDMAFALPAVAPAEVPEQLRNWLTPAERAHHGLIGLNVSGLIYNQPQAAAEQFGLAADYRAIVHQLIDHLLATTTSRLILIPHVAAPAGNPESDFDAAQAVVARLSPADRERVMIAPPTWTPSEFKWVISHTDWFCGTRMHSTIAALSSGVPTSSVSYSLKARGVYRSCGQEHRVLELRHQTTEQILQALCEAYAERQQDRLKLAAQIPAVVDQARGQLDEILSFLATEPAARK